MNVAYDPDTSYTTDLACESLTVGLNLAQFLDHFSHEDGLRVNCLGFASKKGGGDGYITLDSLNNHFDQQRARSSFLQNPTKENLIAILQGFGIEFLGKTPHELMNVPPDDAILFGWIMGNQLLQDFHFARLLPDGKWYSKFPGDPPRTTDERGKQILDPFDAEFSRTIPPDRTCYYSPIGFFKVNPETMSMVANLIDG